MTVKTKMRTQVTAYKPNNMNKKVEEKKYRVTNRAMRPASNKKQCFYCQQPVDGFHKRDCVLIEKKVLVRAVIEYEIDMPANWGKDDIEFNRNEGTWCASNIIEELEEVEDKEGCLCGVARIEYIKDTSEDFLSEN